jgi:chromosome segregation ATPase
MTREDLKVYKYNQEFIKDKLEYIEEQKVTLYKITSTINDMPVGSRKAEDSMAEKLAKLMDSFNELLDKINKMQDRQIEIEEQLLKVDQPYRNILDKIYIQGKTLVKVADEMEYDYKHLCYKHGIALNKFDELDK